MGCDRVFDDQTRQQQNRRSDEAVAIERDGSGHRPPIDPTVLPPMFDVVPNTAAQRRGYPTPTLGLTSEQAENIGLAALAMGATHTP